MSKVFDKLIAIQTRDEVSEDWVTVYTPHAHVNKARVDAEYLNAGAVQGKRSLTFEVRFFVGLAEVLNNLANYQIIYRGIPFNIVDYDDYAEKHRTITLLGVSY